LGELNLPKVLEPSEGCCFFEVTLGCIFLLCFNFCVWGWFWDCDAIARNDGVFWGYTRCLILDIICISSLIFGVLWGKVTLGCIFYFVLILGLGWFWDCDAIARNERFLLGYTRCLILDIICISSLIFGVLWGKVTLGCIFLLCFNFGFGVVLRLRRYRSQWRGFLRLH